MSIEFFPRHPQYAGLAEAISTLVLAQKLSQLPPEQLIQRHADFIRRALSQERTPWTVLVCARNETLDLPKLLFALARSTLPLHLIVVDNNSTDGTTSLAQDFHATVVSAPEPGLIHALTTGFTHLKSTGYQGTLLLTDADTLPVSTWATTMSDALSHFPPLNGGHISGSLCYHESSLAQIPKNLIRTIAALALDVRYSSSGSPRARGPNSAILFDSQGHLLQALSSQLDLTLVRGTDTAVQKTITRNRGRAGFCFSLSALVITKGDRYPTLLDLLHTFLSSQHRETLYHTWHCDRIPTTHHPSLK